MTETIDTISTTRTAGAAVPLPPRVYVPISSGETITLGRRVRRGDVLTKGAVAPADGTLVAVCEVRLLDGRTSPADEIAVESAGTSTVESAPPPTDVEEVIDRVTRCGVWARRHTSPDLLAQLHEILRHPAHTIVCNLLDVDGGSSLNAKLVREHGASIVSGADALAKAIGAGRVWLAAPPRVADRLTVLVRKAKAGARLKAAPLGNDYPQADPTLLLYALLGRRLKPGVLPPEVGALLLDGPAMLAVGRAIEANEPMVTVPVEVRDSTCSRSHITTAAVGTPLQHVLHALGLNGTYTLRAGAALRDVRVDPGAIVAGTELSIDAGIVSPPINPDPCIRCGWCVEACPVRIYPAGLLEAAQDNDPAAAERYGVHACIECGICSYVCPSRLPLLSGIRQLRSGVAVTHHSSLVTRQEPTP